MTTEGLGYVAWWGYSPALDLINLTGDGIFCHWLYCWGFILINAHQISLHVLGLDNTVKVKTEKVKQGTDIDSLVYNVWYSGKYRALLKSYTG